MNEPAAHKPPPPLLKLALDIGPILIFLWANGRYGIINATGIFMAAMVISLGLTWRLERRLAPMPLFSTGLVLIFGGLTVLLADELFIKIKPTLLYCLFAALLWGGLYKGKLFIKMAFGEAFAMTEQGWSGLTHRWSWFFLALAASNEVMWRVLATDTWIAAKLFVFLPATIIFSVAQIPFIQRHAPPEEAQPEAPAP